MTMDRVYNNHQHGFQQQSIIQQQQQQSHLHPHSQPRQQQPSLPHSSQHQHLYQHDHENHVLLYHHQQHHHHSQSHQTHTSSDVPSILHRPAHPPPPPPAFPTSRFLPTNTTENLQEPVNSLATTSVASEQVPTAARNNPQNDYYYSTHNYQVYKPSNLQTRHQHPCTSTNGSQSHTNTNIVADSSGFENYNIASQDYFTEERIQAILAAKEALEKPIEERDERDILLIDNLCSLLHGFDVFPKTVRRALAAQTVLIVIDEKGKELIVHNEELDSFCVLIFGECEQLNPAKTVPIRKYNVGDAFGVCQPITETIRFIGTMITKCENCAFLCVKRDDFYTILTDPANYTNKDVIRHRDRSGNVVYVSQIDISKKSPGPLWPHHMQSIDPFKIIVPAGHVIIKATEPCLLLALVDDYTRSDPEYVDDFLLLFRVFMTYDQKDKDKKLPPGMIRLCLTLTKWLDHVDYRDKVVKIVVTWLSSYYHDFELNLDFSYLFFKIIESRLLKMSMDNQLQLLRVTLSTKSKIRHVIISRSSREQPLTFSISGGYDKNCGIFVTQVYGSDCENCPSDNFMNLLQYYPNSIFDSSKGPSVPPRHRINHGLSNQDLKISVPLKPGDQILEVNGSNFAAIQLVEAQRKLDMSTHLALTVKFNPFAFNEMKAVPEGRRKSSLSSMSSVSPYQPSNSQNKFTFNSHEQASNKQTNEQYPSASPLFSNVNFGFKSIIESKPKSNGSLLSSWFDSSRQLTNKFTQLMRETAVQSSSSNVETMSKASDNNSDNQSNDIDLGKAKSNQDLPSMKSKEHRAIELGLSNMVRLEGSNPTTIADQTSNGSSQTLVNVVRVFNAANNESRYLLVHEETTAREVVMVAVKEFNLTGNSGSQMSPGDKSVSSLNWHLYEVSVVPESKTIKQKCLSEQTSRLAERASLCSRFYIKNNSQSSFGPSRLDMGDDALVNEILKESPANITLTSLNATLLAVELTLCDFDKFRSIEPQQFVYDTFFDYSEKNQNTIKNNVASDSASVKSSSSDGQETDSLHAINKARSIPKSWMNEYQEFADISNREMFWVVCEILNERNISRRVKIVKQFVRVADVCSQLRNYNSMFAIISGLGHSCVNRLKRTFDKLKPKYKNQLEKMRSLFDPSKNMSNYRTCLQQTPPPAIPLFPQIKKDLTFTKEGRSIFIKESNELSDDEDSSFSQDTIRRRSRNDLLGVKLGISDNHITKSTSTNQQQALDLQFVGQSRPISFTNFNNRVTSSENDSILVNFAEIRQFTDRVRNVIYFSSVPYSNDLLTNTKDSQRNQAQIKKMHEEWQMRKRIRHYISQTLTSAIVVKNQSQHSSCDKNNGKLDQTDGFNSAKNSGPGKCEAASFSITYDERTLYQRSLDIEPELNTRLPVMVDRHQAPSQQASSNQIHLPPATLNMQPPPLPLSAANSSPTLSKSSSLSSCSSFNHHLPNYLTSRSNLTSSVGKFGTESTESLRKLQALSENVDDWRPYHGGGSTINSNNGSLARQCDTIRSKGLVPARIFPSKSSR